ncbi:hypothetical protein DNTS_024551 [Danionella cerebrum]|uniref:CCDC92/74 N-terminal domain-containing protein n=1 Tax=Danionella cerebrum TaxID=2873325 RepID=A0A553QRG0_9TELE|nr:hypothetical protein DNTS_024551 [Danionella translucida]
MIEACSSSEHRCVREGVTSTPPHQLHHFVGTEGAVFFLHNDDQRMQGTRATLCRHSICSWVAWLKGRDVEVKELVRSLHYNNASSAGQLIETTPMENKGVQGLSLEQQVESVERSIVFLRQEQLTLLHGLHLEILSLQKRCTELTQELSMKPPGRSQAGIVIGLLLGMDNVLEEEEQLQARYQEVEEHLEDQQFLHGDLRWELSQKSVLVGALRASLKQKERRFLEELKQRSHRTTVLNTELQKQTEAAAYLSFQLHSAKQKLQQQQWKRAEKPPIPSTPQASGSSQSALKPRRQGSNRVSGHLRIERARECVPRERVTGPEEPMAMPDPALFLYPYRNRHRVPLRHTLQEVDGEESEELDQGAAVSRLAATVAKATATTASTAENSSD